MPTYSYRCANCDFAFEQYQAFTEDSLTVCSNCGQPQLRKVFSEIGVTFKGSGFYRTDSRAKPVGSKPGKPNHHQPASEKSGPDKAGSSSSGSTDSPAKKSDKPSAAKSAASSASGSSGKSGSTRS